MKISPLTSPNPTIVNLDGETRGSHVQPRTPSHLTHPAIRACAESSLDLS